MTAHSRYCLLTSRTHRTGCDGGHSGYQAMPFALFGVVLILLGHPISAFGAKPNRTAEFVLSSDILVEGLGRAEQKVVGRLSYSTDGKTLRELVIQVTQVERDYQHDHVGVPGGSGDSHRLPSTRIISDCPRNPKSTLTQKVRLGKPMVTIVYKAWREEGL